MSNYLAVATVTAVIRNHLSIAISRYTHYQQPARHYNTCSPGHSLNFFLYHVAQNARYRNLDQPARNYDAALVRLNFQYMITALAEENALTAQAILAIAMRVLHENPTLTRKMINDTINSSADLASSDLTNQLELVKVTALSLSLEEIMKLWSSFFQTNYRISAMYEATIVVLDRW